jgi:signal transduction histidine kinase
VDLHALLDGLVCDYTDAGRAVTLDAPATLVVTTRPQAVQRIVGHLVDNALKFAGAAKVSAQTAMGGGLARDTFWLTRQAFRVARDIPVCDTPPSKRHRRS